MKKIKFPEQAKFEHEELKRWFLDITDAVNETLTVIHYMTGGELEHKQTQEPERKEPWCDRHGVPDGSPECDCYENESCDPVIPTCGAWDSSIIDKKDELAEILEAVDAMSVDYFGTLAVRARKWMEEKYTEWLESRDNRALGKGFIKWLKDGEK